MLARAGVQRPQLTAGMANLIIQACLPHCLISSCSLLRVLLPDVNLSGPEHNPTLGRGPGTSQGSREPTAMQKWASPSSPLMFLEESELHYSLILSNSTATTIFDDVEANHHHISGRGFWENRRERKLQKQDSHIPTLYS